MVVVLGVDSLPALSHMSGPTDKDCQPRRVGCTYTWNEWSRVILLPFLRRGTAADIPLGYEGLRRGKLCAKNLSKRVLLGMKGHRCAME